MSVDGRSRPALIVVGGGARSGKSRYAVERALAAGRRRLFVATAQVFDDDDEMRERIDKHIAERGDRFRTVEAPIDVATALTAEAGQADVALVDCVTLWLSNLLAANYTDGEVDAAVDQLLAAVRGCGYPVITVTNEVGMGIVPDNPLARRFRDLAGRVNQRLVEQADEIYAAAVGAVLRLRPGAVEMVWPVENRR